jgi:uncharacterized protein with HEPN domain
VNTEPRLKDFLGHILEAVDRIESFSAGMDEAGFLADIKTQDAVIRNLEVIGEACNNIRRVAPEFASAHPEVPWGSAIGNRNALSHGYFSVDLPLVWATVQQDLRQLKATVGGLHATLASQLGGDRG